MGFSKLSSNLTMSSVWSEPLHVRVVWIAFLSLKDESGLVTGVRSTLQRVCNVTMEEYDNAVSILSSPDHESKTKEFEGRRISKCDDGWIVLNHEKYRLHDDIQRENTRNRVRKFRENQKTNSDVTQCNVTDTLRSVSVSVSDSVSSSEEDSKEKQTPHEKTFAQFWAAYPKKKSKGDAEKAWSKIKSPVETLSKILNALEWQKKSIDWTKESGQFVPYPASYLNSRGWEDEQPKLDLGYVPRRIIQ